MSNNTNTNGINEEAVTINTLTNLCVRLGIVHFPEDWSDDDLIQHVLDEHGFAVVETKDARELLSAFSTRPSGYYYAKVHSADRNLTFYFKEEINALSQGLGRVVIPVAEWTSLYHWSDNTAGSKLEQFAGREEAEV